jgi:hypothetical protein
MEMKN